MLEKPKCPIIALEEHYADDELIATYRGLDVNQIPEIVRRLRDVGEERLKSMDESACKQIRDRVVDDSMRAVVLDRATRVHEYELIDVQQARMLPDQDVQDDCCGILWFGQRRATRTTLVLHGSLNLRCHGLGAFARRRGRFLSPAPYR